MPRRPAQRILPREFTQARAQGSIRQHAGNARREGFDLLGHHHSALHPGEHIGRAHHRRGDHRRALGHGLEQHEPLRFGARSEHERIGGAVAIEQSGMPIHVALVVDVGIETASGDERADVRLGRAFTRNDQQHVRHHLTQADQHLDQKIDVLLVGYSSDEQRRRSIGRDALHRAVPRAIAVLETQRRQTRR